MRLDIYLTKHHNIQSRNKAQELISAKKVKINGAIITKPSFKIENNDVKIEILEDKFYVSRSAYKLKKFLDEFKEISIKNKKALDIGSSTGGFTQILLEYGAKNITCVDVGSNQLHSTIKNNPKIQMYENTDIRNFKPSILYDIVTCDVSFISILNILEDINLLAKKEIFILFKPQFEVGAKIKRDKLGVVQDTKAVENAREKFLLETNKYKWQLIYHQPSQLKGKSGNIEEIFYFRKDYKKDKNTITSIAIGGFDGIHLAHQALFDKLDNNGAIIVIETGYASLSKGSHREDYTTLPIFYYNLDDIKHLKGDEFIKLIEDEYQNLQNIVVGYDFHFGFDRDCNVDDLKRFFHGQVVVLDEIKYNNIAVHSKTIREYIKNGEIIQANQLLGKEYKIKGDIIKGQGLGKKQFVPTINIQCNDFLLPASGIYATKTIIDHTQYSSITFLGHRVTTDGSFAVETHIINKDIQVNSQQIEIKFIQKLRDNKKFESYYDLKQQILKDIQNRIKLPDFH